MWWKKAYLKLVHESVVNNSNCIFMVTKFKKKIDFEIFFFAAKVRM